MRAFLLLALTIGATLGCGCASDPTRAALTGDRPPEDFTLSVIVAAPPPTEATPRGARPARYIVQPDGVLRAVQGPATDRTFPPGARLLTLEQTQRLWWDLRDSGLVKPGAPASVPPARPMPLPPGAVTPPSYTVAWSLGGQRRSVVIDTASASPEDAAAARRLADRLASLAWVTE